MDTDARPSRINRNIVECKAYKYIIVKYVINRINRNIVECKGVL